MNNTMRYFPQFAELKKKFSKNNITNIDCVDILFLSWYCALECPTEDWPSNDPFFKEGNIENIITEYFSICSKMEDDSFAIFIIGWITNIAPW